MALKDFFRGRDGVFDRKDFVVIATMLVAIFGFLGSVVKHLFVPGYQVDPIIFGGCLGIITTLMGIDKFGSKKNEVE